MNTSKFKQITLEHYKNWNRDKGAHTQHTSKAPQTTQCQNVHHETSDTNEYRHPRIKALILNTRGMHNTILDLQHIMNTQKKPSTIHLTETKHSHIKSIWREVLKDYKLVHIHPTLDPTTDRGSGGTILAVRQHTYKEVTVIPASSHIGDCISAVTLTPYDGSPIKAISAYMPQLHTKAKDTIYTQILT